MSTISPPYNARTAPTDYSSGWLDVEHKAIQAAIARAEADSGDFVVAPIAGTDAAPLLQTAINQGGPGSRILLKPSTNYLLGSPVVATYDDQVLDFRGSSFVATHSGNVFTIGKTGSQTKRVEANLGYVKHQNATNWVAGSRGLYLINCEWGAFSGAIDGFYEGVSLLGVGTGCEMNRFAMRAVSNALFGLKLFGGVAGYVNENTFYAGEVRYDGYDPAADSPQGYAIHIDRDPLSNGTMNNNRFRDQTLQNSQASHKAKAVYLNGAYTHFSGLRGEGFSAPSIVLGADALTGPNYFHDMGPNFVSALVDIDQTAALNAPLVFESSNGVELSKRFVLSQMTTNPLASDLTSGSNAKDRVGCYMKGGKLVFAYNNAGALNYLVATLDGATATWTNSNTAP